jgi:ATP-dependent Clp protease ATP-binding subunit ClpB
VLDDGHLTDAQGRRVDFKNTVIIMTSNIGSQAIQEYGAGDERTRELVLGVLREHFPPEFLNRVDETIVFHQLGRDELRAIVDIQLRGLERRLAERRITLRFTPAAKDLLIEEGYDPIYGARPLKRAIQRRLLDPLALKLLEGELLDGQSMSVDARGDELVFSSDTPDLALVS